MAGQLVERGGQVLDISPENAAQAVKEGWKPITPDEAAHIEAVKGAGSTGQQALAFAEGAGRGLSFGLSDLALTSALGDEYRKNAALRQEANPNTAMAGEITGVVAPLLLSGGTSGAATAARVASAPVRGAEALGTLAAKGVGKVVGTGAKSAVGRVAQKALAAGAKGAVEGAMFGAGEKISEAALGDHDLLAERLLADIPKGMLEGALAGALLTGGGSVAGNALKETAGGLANLAKGLTSKLDPINAEQWSNQLAVRSLGGSAGNIRALGSDLAQKEAKIQKLGKRLSSEKILDATASKEEMLSRTEKLLPESGKKLESLMQKLDEHNPAPFEVNEMKLRAYDEVIGKLETSAADRKTVKKLEKELNAVFQTIKENNSIENAWFQQQRLGKQIFKEVTGEYKNAFQRELANLQTFLRKEIEEVADRTATGISEDIGNQWRFEKARYSELKTIQSHLTSAVNSNLGKGPVGFRDLVSGLTTAAASPLLGPVAAGASYLAREYGDQALSQVLRSISGLEGLQAKSSEILQASEKSVKAALDGSAKTATQAIPLKQAPKLVEQLRNYAANPAAIQESLRTITAPVAQYAPTVATAMATTLINRLDFLASKLPRTANIESITPLHEKPRESEEELRKFLRYYEATMNPSSVMQGIAKGKLSAEAREALAATSPRYWSQIQKVGFEHLAKKNKALSLGEKRRANSLLGIPTDATMTPRFVSNYQKMKQATAQPEEGRQGGRRRKAVSRDSSLYASPSSTLARRI